MKMAWRGHDRDGESFIYDKVESYYRHRDDHPAAVARFVDGQDVQFPGSNDAIRVSALRNVTKLDRDFIMHRVVLGSVGRNIWEYKTELELLSALRDCVRGKPSAIFYNCGIA